MNGASGPSERAAGEPINTVTIPKTFKIQEVDGLTSPKPIASSPGAPQTVFGELGVLEKLVGVFKGTGLNMIFRPSFGSSKRDNVLEYNVTSETMTFLKELGDIPNRGLGKQADVMLKGVPYTQVISDLLDPDTGKANRSDPVGIHFEQGLFLRTPPTDVRPVVRKGTISRLASVPHGATINCQGFEPDLTRPTPGAPKIEEKPASIIPFPIGHPEDTTSLATTFPQTNFKITHDLRIPQEIKSGGALTEALMQNPNKLLTDTNQDSTKKSIKQHIFFTVASDSKTSEVPGGGTSNIGFLQGPDGTPKPGGNAHAVSITCDYWISIVEYDVLLPAGDFSGDKQKLVTLVSEAAKEEAAAGKPVLSPTFVVHLMKPVPANTIAKFQATQVQYSQNVILDFNGVSWPHISVATLLPADPVHIKAPQVVF